MSQSLFFYKQFPRCVWADSIEKCPAPTTDWTDQKPDYSANSPDSSADNVPADSQ